MHRAPSIDEIKRDIETFFMNDVDQMGLRDWGKRDSAWTDGIHKHVAEIGHRHGCRVFADMKRCLGADSPECLYDHHWRLLTDEGEIVRVPLVMEIEWGFGPRDIWARIAEDFVKLVQARADLRVMVFQRQGIAATIDRLISLAQRFEGTQSGDQYFFAGWEGSTNRMVCRSWTAQ